MVINSRVSPIANLESIDVQLRMLAERDLREYFNGNNAFLALAFQQDLKPCEIGLYGMDLTYESGPSSNLALTGDLQSGLKKLADVNPDDFMFKMRYVVSPATTRTPNAFLFLTLGAFRDYGKKDNRDVVDQRHDVDSWGTEALKIGAKHKQLPRWAYSNYNFMQIKNLRSQTFDNPQILDLARHLTE